MAANANLAALFHVLPPHPTTQGQTVQSADQVQSILALPPNILAQIARTEDPEELHKLLNQSDMQGYVPSMLLRPPSPSALYTGSPYVGSHVTHYGIPYLLHKRFSPHATGILAVATEPSAPFTPTYASVEDWARAEAHQIIKQPDAAKIAEVTDQLKRWATTKEEHDIRETVIGAKSHAVNLAASAAMQQKGLLNKSVPAVTHQPTSELSSVRDFSAYAEHYREELNSHAQGYYPTLHREALNQLLEAQSPATQATQPMQRVRSDQANQVRAAAVAAITANVLAAQDMAAAANETLVSMGIDVSSIPAPTVPAPPSRTLAQSTAPSASPLVRAPSRVVASTFGPAANSNLKGTRAVQLVEQVERDNGCSPEARNELLAYAHQQYTNNVADVDLLPLLHMLDRVHPGHCPTLLLLSCVYYSKGIRMPPESPKHRHNLEASIVMNQRILEIDPEYVEAMSNIGTTLRALGNLDEAELWWYKAIKLRPTYFDSVENLLGVLCNAQSDPRAAHKPAKPPRFQEGVDLCSFVEKSIFSPQTKPYALPKVIPTTLIHRIQNLFYAKGNLQAALGDFVESKNDYESGIELVLSAQSDHRRIIDSHGKRVQMPAASLPDLLVGAILAGLVLMARQHPESAQTVHLQHILSNLGIVDMNAPPMDYFQIARFHRAGLLPYLQDMAAGLLPLVLITPDKVKDLLPLLFADTGSTLPALSLGLSHTSADEQAKRTAAAHTRDQVGQTTSTLLLTLAKTFSDAMLQPQGSIAMILQATGLPLHTSLVLPLYYIALALHPSPSTFNNLGILLSTLPATTIVNTPQGLRTMSGQALAMEYYKAGLEIDNKHPHLYTNLGSLLKDMGHLAAAVQMYEKAVEFNPTFDVALANLANAIKDMGHVQDSVMWYRRAVEINPVFPEAVCGLVNALCGVCDWKNRGGLPGELAVGPANEILNPGIPDDVLKMRNGWMPRVVELVNKQLFEGRQFGHRIVALSGGVDAWMRIVSHALGTRLAADQAVLHFWQSRFQAFSAQSNLPPTANEGGWVIRVIEHLMRHVQRRWYISQYGKTVRTNAPLPLIETTPTDATTFARPLLPSNLPLPPVPTVLPFHTFTYPLSARQTRLICHRNALRISFQALNQPWLPPHVFPPPPPPAPRLRIGYVSSDFNNHPLAHLMQSAFGMHDRSRFEIFCYATTASDASEYREKISREAEHFTDVSAWTVPQVITKILADGIHILVNMNGYTKGARNEIFASRPCPVQLQLFMGFAGTLGAGWADWVIADEVIAPKNTVASEVWAKRQREQRPMAVSDLPGSPDPEEASDDWMYTEKMAYFPKTYFITDHRQGFRDELDAQKQAPDGETAWKLDETRRWQMRRELFPQLSDNVVIFCCLNQLYKIDPFVFRIWLNILAKVPNSVLWLLRFPASGEENLKTTAREWAGADVAARIIFTDVAPKQVHISRGRIADLFLDSTEVGGHTTSADVLWSGTPIITFPRHIHKLCSRVAASIANATGHGNEMVVHSKEEYEQHAVTYASTLKYDAQRNGSGPLYELRKKLFLSRDQSALFDTPQWVRNAEASYEEMWRRYVEGTEFEGTAEWVAAGEPSPSIDVASLLSKPGQHTS